MIHELLAEGRANAIKGKDICMALGITPRDLTLLVEKERREGKPICAATGGKPGYFLAANKEEMQRYCRSLWKRAGEIHKTRRACLGTLEQLPEGETADNGTEGQ